MWDRLTDLISDHPDQINALAAVCALLVSFLSIVLTFLALWLQRRHNFKSVTPLGSILVGDYEDALHVTLKNTGIGPLIIDQFRASSEKEEKKAVIFWMPALPRGIHWSNFTPEIDGRSLPPNESMVLLELEGDDSDGGFVAFRDDVRRALSRLTVSLTYRDIYNRKMPTTKRHLAWFGRKLVEESELPEDTR
jgi:hypothetical protein